MKRIFTLLMGLFICSVTLNAQPYQYFFNNVLTEAGGGPDLIEVQAGVPCPGTAGAFSNQTITTRSGICGNPSQPAFDFNVGDGFDFDNSGSLIGGEYTIHLLFKFATAVGSHRVIDFQDNTVDQGIYVHEDSFDLHSGSGHTPLIGAPPPPNFAANTYTLFTITRSGTSPFTTTIYVDGSPTASYDDAGGLFAPLTATTNIRFFIDNDCENEAGSVKYISLSPTLSTDQQVLDTWNALCSTILPLRLTNFVANKQSSSVVLNWSTVSETNTNHFELERSSTGTNFTSLANVRALNNAGNNNYSYIDKTPFTGTGFYRVKIVDVDGQFKYSSILKINFTGAQRFEIYPNPVRDVITISGIKNGHQIKLVNMEGKELVRKISTGQSMTMDINKYPSGLYYIQYFDGTTIQNKKVIKQ